MLAGRGIAREHIDAALGPDGPAEQLARAEALLARRGQAPSSDAERAKALAYLTRRGYDLELSYEAIRRSGREAA